jgi:citrate lyase beta subunit
VISLPGSAPGPRALRTSADVAGVCRECEDAAAMGFTGKITVHPDQLAGARRLLERAAP